jgi:hypothetical protein
MQKLLLDYIGEAKTNSFSLRGYISRLFKIKKKRLSPPEYEQKKFQEEVREQLIELKNKGINIPIFTL